MADRRQQRALPKAPAKEKAAERMAVVNRMPKLEQRLRAGHFMNLPAKMLRPQAHTPISADKMAALRKALNLRLGR